MPRYTYAIAGLRDKRARLAGETEAAERAIAKQREAVAALDATMRLFHPDADPAYITSIHPIGRSYFFRRGKRMRFCVEALRDAGAPLPTPAVGGIHDASKEFRHGGQTAQTGHG
jgi:hypothetical protein